MESVITVSALSAVTVPHNIKPTHNNFDQFTFSGAFQEGIILLKGTDMQCVAFTIHSIM